MRFAGKVVIITGADGGIGRATAVLMAGEGADVAVGCHSDREGAEETARLVRNAGRRAAVWQGDVGRRAEVERLFAETTAELGAPDLLVANAGKGMGGKTVEEMDDALMEEVLRTNLVGPLLCAREFVKARKAAGGRGRLLVIGSVAGHLPTPGSAPYGMSKAGVNSLVRSLSVELAPDRINVNALAPGLIATPMTQERLDDPAKRADSMENIPWGRPGEPEEIAGLAAFMLSDAADYVTGQTWVMDGGLTMNWGGA